MKRKVLKKAIAVVSAAALLVSAVPVQQAQAAKKIKLNKTKVTIKVGRSVKLKLKNAKKKVTWTSGNKKIAVVNKKGKVTGKAAGKVKITAKSGGKKYICSVSVKKKESTKPASTNDSGKDISGSATPAVSQTPGTSQTPSGSSSPGQTKKPLLDATITPSESQTPSGSDAPTQSETPGSSDTPSQSQTPGSSDTPSQSQAPGSSDTPSQSQTPGSSDTPSQSQAPGSSDTPSQSETPGSSESPSESDAPVQSQSPSETQSPTQTTDPDEDEPTLEISEIALGMSIDDVRGIMGQEDRSEATPQGYTGYIFNPDMTYEDYILVYMDNEKVVGWATMSKNYSYGDLVSVGDSASALSGFSGMTSYDYEAGYLYKGTNEYVMAFSDHQNDSKIYAVQVFSKTNGSGNSVELDKLMKPEHLTYAGEINTNMANQLADWVNTFRCNLGLKKVKYYASGSETGADAAQKHSEDMASANNVSSTSSNGTTYQERFEANYREIANAYEGDTLGKGENNGGRSPDAFGFVTWWIDDSDVPVSRTIICRSSAVFNGEEEPLTDYYLCTGFTYNSEASGTYTFATLDFFY